MFPEMPDFVIKEFLVEYNNDKYSINAHDECGHTSYPNIAPFAMDRAEECWRVAIVQYPFVMGGLIFMLADSDAVETLRQFLEIELHYPRISQAVVLTDVRSILVGTMQIDLYSDRNGKHHRKTN